MNPKKNGKVVLVHSYKGGTGKSSIALNLGKHLVNNHKKTLVIEQDVSGPTFKYVFPNLEVKSHWNDFYNNNVPIRELIVSSDVGFDLILAQDGNYEIPTDKNPKLFFGRHLERLNQQKKWLTATYDYILLDTHPGYSYELINSILIADIAILLTRLDYDTVKKTISMYKKLYDNFQEKKMIIVQNQVPPQIIDGIPLDSMDTDVKETLVMWNNFVEGKKMVSIPLHNEIAYALFKSKLVAQHNLFFKFIEELANYIIL